MSLAKGDRVRPVGCAGCVAGTVRVAADGQVLVDYDDGRSTWEDAEQVELAPSAPEG
jgi:hypothetical protein